MKLHQVIIPADIYHLILSHAYSTENEEIIGMLIGYWEEVPSNNPYIGAKTIAQVKYLSFLTRSDKRKDRVEIAPESLHLAALEAEEISKKLDKDMMVIGWYHSHPHITVFPSHVDIRTQLSQQLMDDRFFGIIVSCFDTNNDNTEKIQITCFQSKDTEKVNIPLVIEPRKQEEEILTLYQKLPEHMYEEHKKEYNACHELFNYNLRSSGNSSLPNSMTELYNASVYGQCITSLIDNMIIPATHVLDLKAIELDKEIEELKKSLTSSNNSPSPNKPKSTNNIQDYLIDL